MTRLLDLYGLGDAAVLVEQKRRGELAQLPGKLRDAWASRVGKLAVLFDQAAAASPSPEQSPNGARIEEWLVAARLHWLRAGWRARSAVRGCMWSRCGRGGAFREISR